MWLGVKSGANSDFGGQKDDMELRLRRLGGKERGRENQPSRWRGNPHGVETKKASLAGELGQGGEERDGVRPGPSGGLAGRPCRSCEHFEHHQSTMGSSLS